MAYTFTSEFINPIPRNYNDAYGAEISFHCNYVYNSKNWKHIKYP